MNWLKKFYLFCITLHLLMVILLFSACGGGTGSTNQTENPISGTNQTQDCGIIMGKVQDNVGSSLGGVTITADKKTTTSNEQGFFSLGGIPESDRLVVNLTKEGHVGSTHITKVQTGESSFIEAFLCPVEKTVNFLSIDGVTPGETYTNSGASVQIGPDALTDASGNLFNGTASIAITPFDPTTEKGMNNFPGEFKGVTTSGGSVFLESFGFIDITITDNLGTPLNLAPGKQAEIKMPLPSNPGHSSPPTTIPLWHFNTNDGQWHEEGSGYLNGSYYQGNVTHFSAWNFDKNWPPDAMAWVRGRVINATTGMPVKGARVIIKGSNWTAVENGIGMDGSFLIPVMPNSSGTIQAMKNNVKSQINHIYSTSMGEEVDVGSIYMGGTPKIQITLNWGQDPTDLDAHLAIPVDGSWSHLFFGTPGKSVDGAKLSTDDMTSFGPEIITVFELKDGVYRYSVHHFLGSGNLSSSKAKVNLIIDGVGIYPLTPPAGAQGMGDLWRGWDITVSEGKVVNVQVINDYLNDVNSLDLNAFTP